MSVIDVVLGVVGRAHGLNGEVFLTVRTDSPELRFHPGAVVYAGTSPLRVAAFRTQGERAVISFEQVSDRGSAEALRGVELIARVESEESPDGEDEYYDHQLIGLTVVAALPREATQAEAGVEQRGGDVAGEILGEVVRVEHLGFQDMLVIATPAGERLVPFVHALVPEVDLHAKLVKVHAIPGLLEDGEQADDGGDDGDEA